MTNATTYPPSVIAGRTIVGTTRTGTIIYSGVTNEFGSVLGHELTVDRPLNPFERERRLFTCSCGEFAIRDYDATTKRAFAAHKAASA